MDLKALVESRRYGAEEVRQKAGQIYRTVLRESRFIRKGNFNAFSREDLALLFEHYDRLFLDGQVKQSIDDGRLELRFRVSKTMISAAGKTIRTQHRFGTDTPFEIAYRISVSSTLLIQTFREETRAATVAGIPCRDRLQALQRVMEHEIVHLAELLTWTRSSCSAQRFRDIALRLFGHTEAGHRLITPRERALTEFGIRPGDRVAFDLGEIRRVGFVNRITKRATVLVEDARGAPYSDGKRYRKFYVPVPMLKPLRD